MDDRLQDLIDVPMFQALLNRLNDLHVFPSAIIDTDGNVLTATAWQDVCTRFHRGHAEGQHECLASDRYLQEHIEEASPAVTYRCPHGLTDAAIPIRVRGRVVAGLFTGQVFLEPPDLGAFRRQAAAYGFDEAAYLAAVAKVPVWSGEEFNSRLRFLAGLVEIIEGVAERRCGEHDAQSAVLRQAQVLAEAREANAQIAGRLQLVTAAAGAGVWDWNLVTGEMAWDDRMRELYGRPRNGPPLGVEAWQERLHPEDKARALAEGEAALAGTIDYDTEFRVCRPDGSVISVQATGLVLRDPSGRPTRMLGLNTDVTAKRRVEEELRESRENLALALRSSEMGVWRFDLHTQSRRFDDLVCRCLGIDPSAFRGTADEFYSVVHPDDRARLREGLAGTITSGTPYEVEYRVVWPDGSVRHIAARARLTRDSAGQPLAVNGVLWDVTDRKRAEEEKARLEGQLDHAQRLESVGRLAGGVAHDFNNMLGVILGTASLALHEVDGSAPLRRDLEEIRRAAERAASITRQLLAFARRQPIAPQVVNLNDEIGGTLTMLGRLIGEDISLRWLPAADLWPVRIDPAQVDQVLANLCVNARDAIDGVGHITVETANVTFGADYCDAHPGYVPGDYVRVAVTDDGCGIDRETLPMVFEPFFTTKPTGQGTGLGLATVYGIVKQNHGFVSVYSEVGQGTTFALCLPRVVAAVPAERRPQDEDDAPRGGAETVLIVEDEFAILKLGTRILRSLGYHVLPAASPTEALRLAAEAPAHGIDLVLSDVVMPEMNGRDLASRIAAIHPGIKCLFMSGYTANVIAERGVLDEGVSFLEKPFSPDRLASKVREALDR